jgi:hypothetical protein
MLILYSMICGCVSEESGVSIFRLEVTYTFNMEAAGTSETLVIN